MTHLPAPARPAEDLPPVRPPFDAYRLPLPERRGGLGALVSLLAHGLVVLALVWRGTALLRGGGDGRGTPGGGGGGRPRAVSFFTLPPPSAPVAVDIPSPPALSLAEMPTPNAIPLDLVRIELARVELGATSGAGAGPGAGGGTGTGAGPGTGADPGPGTGGEGSYIFPANPRGVILPPMNAPGSVKGRRHRVRFSVGVDGRVARVAVVPEIRDAKYRREFIERMMAYLFTPARTRDGTPVASVFELDVTP